MKIMSENEVLRPVDLKLHTDNWPIHHLRNVNVISHRTQQSVSLLESNKEHVVQVTGLLETSKACRSQQIAWTVVSLRRMDYLISSQARRSDGDPSALRSPMLAFGPSRRIQMALSACGLQEKLAGSSFMTLYRNIEVYSMACGRLCQCSIILQTDLSGYGRIHPA